MSDSPLAGRRILVTRPEHQANELVTAIGDAGGEAIRFPVIEIIGRSKETIAQDLASQPTPDVCIFVSPNAVNHGLATVRGGLSASTAIAAVGPSTTAAIEASGTGVSISSDVGFDSEHLLAHPALNDVQGKNILIVRGERGRELLAETLTRRGANVSYLSVYRRELRQASTAELDALETTWRDKGIDCVTIMSVETLENLLQQLSPASLEQLRKTRLVAPGARVIQTAMELVPGIPVISASGPQTADMLNALIDALHSGQN